MRQCDEALIEAGPQLIASLGHWLGSRVSRVSFHRSAEFIRTELQGDFRLNAQANVMQTARAPLPAARAEHISIESTPEETAAPIRRARGKVLATYTLKSPLRGCETELSLLEDHFVAVRCARPNTLPKKYDVDLRFVNPRPVRIREISWTWLIVTAGLIALASGTIATQWSLSPQPWLVPGIIAAFATLLVSALTGFLFMRRTTESLEFRSIHGEATLLSVTGGIGSARDGKRFFVALMKDINTAKAARPQEKPQFLRDEMREHHRLRELGVLSEEEYEQSKARILAEHA
jgi:hypothetical protein